MKSPLRPTGLLAVLLIACVFAAGQVTDLPRGEDPAGELQQQANITPEAQALLDRLREAYADCNTLELGGTLAMDYDVAGQRQSHQSHFKAQFRSPNQLRHELDQDALIVGDGSKAFLHLIRLNKYTESAMPEGRAARAGLDGQILAILRAQNPSLFLALCEDAAHELADEALSIAPIDDVKLDDVSFPALKIETEEQEIRMLIDPQTGLIRQVNFDLSKSLIERGVPRVNKAIITIDYTTIQPGAAVGEAQFAWAPPAGATLVRNDPSAAEGAVGGPGDPQALVGKSAPDFSLPDLEGKSVALKRLRGSVVVLDFWATWCGPCRVALPHLDQLHRDFTDAGVKVFAVNLKEDQSVAQKYMESNNLSLPVLLDTTGKVAERFGVSGIPHTVVVDQKGVIRKVIVGFGPKSAAELREAVEQINPVR